MSDPYRLAHDHAPSADTPPADAGPQRATSDEAARRDGQRAVLWALLVLSAVANSVTSAMPVPLAISLALGGLTLASIIALVVSHTRGRR
ncbi:hypothetical protein QUV83_16900 [Cellulomonas cellasea]|uniref:hypothetical protein n=1 Tax=Cellulomonas cellasea TaxID=43670 RepID=UPI0025A4A27D|nr:hypothetical protein [Cellulomonas cellasea]MDM8086453.1 hypothetical protein [Cellulomonas cellasea]